MTGSEPGDTGGGRGPTADVRRMLDDLIDRARGGVGEVADPGTQALLETTAEVLIGLRRAYEHHDRGSEEAWRDVGEQPAGRRPDRAPDHTSAQAAEAAVDQTEDRL